MTYITKIGQAVKETIFQLAVLHLVILVFQTIQSGDWAYLNMASILDVQFIVPDVEYTTSTSLILMIPVAIIFLINYLLAKGSSKSP